MAQNAKKNAALLKSAPNGCGAGWTIYLVPDSIPLVACTFKAACDAHDGCYGKCTGRDKDPRAPECEYLRCKPGGDLDGSQRCRTDFKLIRLTSDAQKRRQKCDTAIGSTIAKDNAGRAVCQAFSYAYENAVKSFGEPYFQGLDVGPVKVRQSKEDYEAAIRDFFRDGTPEEFEEFNANPPDFSRDLVYVRGQGLKNLDSTP